MTGAEGGGTSTPGGVAQGFAQAWKAADADGAWLAVSAQNTDRVPGAETMTADSESLQATADQDLSVNLRS
ncbi:hypothetical protein LTH96_04905 [Nesterenkonia sp. LB17]|uniref:hypothetical protein n=1 Tax=Nesterenkonia sp. LB17 TaxID=2901230 RepID=UPI001F4D28F4|nr:hypothetical protein [Nesterenkonia sp. LB17]MCH8565075.1 hypothetical protein [Nesterenkonia sp. LB17]